MDLPRADAGNVQHMMALRREQHVEQVEQIAANPVIEEKRQEASSSPDPVMQDNEEALVQGHENSPPRPTVEELDKHELTHVVFRLVQTLCFGQGKGRSTSTHRNTRGSYTKGHVGLDVLHE